MGDGRAGIFANDPTSVLASGYRQIRRFERRPHPKVDAEVEMDVEFNIDPSFASTDVRDIMVHSVPSVR